MRAFGSWLPSKVLAGHHKEPGRSSEPVQHIHAPWNLGPMPPFAAGQTVIVTGASRGIGLEFVRQLAQRGCRVVAAVRSPPAAPSLLRELGGVIVTELDVTRPDSVQRWAAAMAELAPHVDVLINNAGIYGRRIDLGTVTADDMLAAFTTNTIGPLLVVQALHQRGLLGGAAPSLVASISSKVGSVDDNRSGGGYAYRASKAALNIVNKSLSVDLGPSGVTCTLLHPGWVRTDMTSGQGLIDTQKSVAGMLAVLGSGRELQGRFHDYAGVEIPW